MILSYGHQNFFIRKESFQILIFFYKNCEIALKFHTEVIMPELLGQYFTKNLGKAKIMHWCICDGVDDGRPMIKCDHDNCNTKWFHFECVQLETTPKEPWFCETCHMSLL